MRRALAAVKTLIRASEQNAALAFPASRSKGVVLQELVSPFKLLNALGIFLLYTVDNLIQLFSFWSICFRQVSAWAFFVNVTVFIWSLSMARWSSLHWYFSFVLLYLISIWSLPINQRWKTALTFINNLLFLIGWLNLTFHWQNYLWGFVIT